MFQCQRVTRKTTNESAKFEIIKAFPPLFTWTRQKTSIKMPSIESGFVIGPSNILFTGVYGCTIQPENFTGWGSEGVKQDVRCIHNVEA